MPAPCSPGRFLGAVAALLLLHPAAAPSEDLALNGLRWLARNQHEDGAWGDSKEDPAARVRLTGMALLAFYEAGYTHLSRDAHDGIVFGQVVKKGLLHLMACQNEDGALAPDRTTSFVSRVYPDAHIGGTLALSEAYGMTNSPLLKSPATKAVAWLEKSQRPDGGWGDGNEPDPVLTSHAILAIHSANLSGLDVPTELKKGIDRILNPLIDRGIQGRFGPAASAAVLAVAKMWNKKREPAWQEWAARVGRDLAESDAQDPVLTYWGTCALRHYGDLREPAWKRWSNQLHERFSASQCPEGDGTLRGSWDPPRTKALQEVAPPKSVPPELRQRSEALIEELADEEWAVRERATAELLRLGPEALPLILEATFNPDPEVVHRATHVAQELAAPGGDDQRIETTSLNIWSMQLTYIRSPAVFAPR